MWFRYFPRSGLFIVVFFKFLTKISSVVWGFVKWMFSCFRMNIYLRTICRAQTEWSPSLIFSKNKNLVFFLSIQCSWIRAASIFDLCWRLICRSISWVRTQEPSYVPKPDYVVTYFKNCYRMFIKFQQEILTVFHFKSNHNDFPVSSPRAPRGRR